MHKFIDLIDELDPKNASLYHPLGSVTPTGSFGHTGQLCFNSLPLNDQTYVVCINKTF